MSRDLSSLFATEAVQYQQNQLVHLLVLSVGDTVLRYTDANEPTLFKDVAYTPFPFQYTAAEMNADNTVSKATLIVANPQRVLIPYLESYDGLRGYRVEVITGFSHLLGLSSVAGSNHISEEYLIDSFQMDDKTLTFSLEPVINFDIKLPRRRFMPDSCGWRYRDPHTCQYGSGTMACSGTAARGSVSLTGLPSSLIQTSLESGSRILVESVADRMETWVTAADSTGGTVTMHDAWQGAGSTVYVTLALCDKTLSGKNGCRRHGNQLRYGGFPGVPNSSRRFYI